MRLSFQIEDEPKELACNDSLIALAANSVAYLVNVETNEIRTLKATEGSYVDVSAFGDSIFLLRSEGILGRAWLENYMPLPTFTSRLPKGFEKIYVDQDGITLCLNELINYKRSFACYLYPWERIEEGVGSKVLEEPPNIKELAEEYLGKGIRGSVGDVTLISKPLKDKVLVKAKVGMYDFFLLVNNNNVEIIAHDIKVDRGKIHRSGLIGLFGKEGLILSPNKIIKIPWLMDFEMINGKLYILTRYSLNEKKILGGRFIRKCGKGFVVVFDKSVYVYT